MIKMWLRLPQMRQKEEERKERRKRKKGRTKNEEGASLVKVFHPAEVTGPRAVTGATAVMTKKAVQALLRRHIRRQAKKVVTVEAKKAGALVSATADGGDVAKKTKARMRRALAATGVTGIAGGDIRVDAVGGDGAVAARATTGMKEKPVVGVDEADAAGAGAGASLEREEAEETRRQLQGSMVVATIARIWICSSAKMNWKHEWLAP